MQPASARGAAEQTGFEGHKANFLSAVSVLKDVRVIISMMVLCNANVIIEYDRRVSGIPCAPQYRVLVLET